MNQETEPNRVTKIKLFSIFLSASAYCVFNVVLFYDLILYQTIADKELYSMTTIIYLISTAVVSLFSIKMILLNTLKEIDHYFILTAIFIVINVIHILGRMTGTQIFDPVELSKLVFKYSSITVTLFIIFQLPTLKIYISVPYYAIKSIRAKKRTREEQQYFYNLMVQANADTGLLGLLDACLRAVPILIIQLAIFIKSGCDLKTLSYFDAFAILSRICLLGLPAMSYQAGLRQISPNKKEMEVSSMAWYCFWNFCIIFARCLCIGSAAAAWPLTTTVLVTLHCIGWAFWLWWTHEPLAFYDRNKYVHVLFCLVIGVVYNCIPINLKEEPTHPKYLVFHVLLITENVLGLLALYYHTDHVYICHGVVLFLSLITIIVGYMFQFMYYEKCHPSRVAHDMAMKSITETNTNEQENQED